MIILNNELFHLNTSDLPCLIHGVEHTGSSFFTVKLIVDLFQQGNKFLFFSAFPTAKEQFLKEADQAENIGQIYSHNDIKQEKQAILVMENNPNLFIDALKILPDISERIVIIKNVDLIDMGVVKEALALTFEKIIFSGDIDKCSLKEKILQKNWQTKIIFSELAETILPVELPKYKGYCMNNHEQGIIEAN